MNYFIVLKKGLEQIAQLMQKVCCLSCHRIPIIYKKSLGEDTNF